MQFLFEYAMNFIELKEKLKRIQVLKIVLEKCIKYRFRLCRFSLILDQYST